MEIKRDIWPDWIIGEPLDSGAFGEVYLASHRDNPRLQCAVKVIEVPRNPAQTEEWKQAGLSDAQIRRRYEQAVAEYRAQVERLFKYKGISHIMNVEDFRAVMREDGMGGTLYIRMELLKSLPEYLSDKRLSEAEIAAIGIDICEALEICHADGMLHRDIKPANIFVNDRLKSGILFKLGDFSAAQPLLDATGEADMQGTLNYMAPETVNENRCDERSDLYSLGLTLYQLMNNGRLPFWPPRQLCSHEEKLVALKSRLAGAPLPDPADASPAFAAILRKACAVDPANRYASAAEMKHALQALTHAETDSPGNDAVKNPNPGRARWLRLCLVAALCLLCLALGGLLLRERLRNHHEEGVPQATAIPMITVIEKGAETP